jgi:hypothetical protein
MLQAHSLLWHYLWVAPSVLLLVLGGRLWRLCLHKQYLLFFALAISSAIEQLTLYFCDLVPSVTPETWWRIFWAGLLVEGLLKFALVGQIFARAFGTYPSVAKLGQFLIRGVGASLVLAAALAAAYAPKDSVFGIVSGAHLLEQAIYLIEAGLLVFIFFFSSYFRLSLSRPLFGIALGLSISACVHLATWAVAANAGLPTAKRVTLDFVNMATYHVCVLIWFYYLLVPRKVVKQDTIPPKGPSAGSPIGLTPEEDLEVWNRELERLVQQ